MRKLLIANRGEIAARIMRTAHDLGIATVAVFSDPDADAPYVTLADESVRLPGAAPADTYLRADLIIAAALATGADAIHPGYGFLSENEGFARACGDAGLTFVGPTPEAISAMGSKIEAKALMAAAGVPVLPGETVATDGGTDGELKAAGERVGYPLLVKAAYGGGGRGMRLVEHAAGLTEAVERARSEAASAFGDGTVFLERFVVDPRHVEVQIFGDTYGTVVHLFERECSIQRRYQKIVEESPSPAVDDTLREALGAAAVAAGRAIGYVGAGTVEFVLDSAGAFYFLEVNTRLQVEHPVTEAITGLDLVEMQLRVAEGELLPAEVLDATITGHAIEVRLYAEDVPAGFLPATGVLHRFTIPTGPGVRVDTGYRDGSVVSPHYDAMLAKVIAHGRTRADAARRLARALATAELHGVTTNRDLLLAILTEPEFLAAHTDTGYLTRHDPAALSASVPRAIEAHAVAAALARRAGNRSVAPVLGTLPAGWRNVRSAPSRVTFAAGADEYVVTYQPSGDVIVNDATINDVTVNGVAMTVRVNAATPTRVDAEIDGVRHIYDVHRVTTGTRLDVYVGGTSFVEVPRFGDPDAVAHVGSLLAPMPGLVIRTLVDVGVDVIAGQPLVVLEAMKMEHTVAAPAAGVVTELHVKAGDQVATGQALVVVDVVVAAA